jgi:hypothetical protein
MENAKDLYFEKEFSSRPKSPELAIILEALELLNEVKRYRGVFYKQKVASLEAKAKKLNIC